MKRSELESKIAHYLEHGYSEAEHLSLLQQLEKYPDLLADWKLFTAEEDQRESLFEEQMLPFKELWPLKSEADSAATVARVKELIAGNITAHQNESTPNSGSTLLYALLSAAAVLLVAFGLRFSQPDGAQRTAEIDEVQIHSWIYMTNEQRNTEDDLAALQEIIR
ncbi:MAG: hypothetical protein LAT67_13060 [Balneolales bacterium]|nr:hypothetical protein [Balneolales bacterium]